MVRWSWSWSIGFLLRKNMHLFRLAKFILLLFLLGWITFNWMLVRVLLTVWVQRLLRL